MELGEQKNDDPTKKVEPRLPNLLINDHTST